MKIEARSLEFSYSGAPVLRGIDFTSSPGALTVILGAAAVVAIAPGGWLEGVGILLALLLSAGIGFLSEYETGRAFDILNRCEDDTPVKVRRDGLSVLLPRGEVVLGDLMNIEAGEEVPADAEVLEAVEFRVDQSKFTGEPEPVDKVPKEHPGFAELAATATYPPDRLLRGSHEGFLETLICNTALLRRRIRSEQLTFRLFQIGSTSRTDVVVC